MFREALQYPRSGDGAWRRILIGGVLTALSALIVPAILLAGYYTRVLKAAMTDAAVKDVPEFDQWWDLLTTGLGFVAVAIVYGLVPAIVVAIGTQTSAAVASLGGFLGLLVYYLLPAGLANYARKGNFTAAFDVGALSDVVLDGEYAFGWLLALVVLVVGGAIAAALSVVVVGIFVAFYVAVVAFRIYGRAFGAALGRGREAEAAGGAPTA